MDERKDRFKYLDKSRYRFRKSLSTSNLLQQMDHRNIGESIFTIETQKESMIDVFNIMAQHPVLPQPLVYDPRNYFSPKVESILSQIKQPRDTGTRPKIPKPNPNRMESPITNPIPGIHAAQQSTQLHYSLARSIQTMEPRTGEVQGNNQQGVQLLVCGVCNRKFVEGSYQRHVNVCEKVFFKKRPVFKGNSRGKSRD